MSICLCGMTADKMLELLAKNKTELETVTGARLSEFSANIDDARDVLGDYLGGVDLPIELLVGSKKMRRASDRVVTHYCSKSLPDGAIKRIDEGLYVISPELCLLEQATELHLVNLCMMLGRFMATATPDRNAEDTGGVRKRAPLTSVDRVYEFLANAKQMRGVASLREALRWTAPGAASPQETNLQLALTLPPKYGGFGLRMPEMNYKVPLEGIARELYPEHESIRIDLAWSEWGIGLEYQGEEHGAQLGEDYARYLAADASQFRLWYVAKRQLESPVEMDYLAQLVAGKIRKRINEQSWPTREHTRWLLSVLRGDVLPRPGVRFDLRGKSGRAA